MNVLLDRIETLLDEPLCGAQEPTLERLETTLTDGYAQALQLESDRMKIERRISEVAGSSAEAEAKVEELASLTRRLSTTGRDLDRLRQLLATLRLRARSSRDRISPQHSLQA